VETEHGLDSEAPANERAGYRQAKPKPPRHISTLQVEVLKGHGFSRAAKAAKSRRALQVAEKCSPVGMKRQGTTSVVP
jgi:hypothetical protein